MIPFDRKEGSMMGYLLGGSILRIDLTEGRIDTEPPSLSGLRRWCPGPS